MFIGGLRLFHFSLPKCSVYKRGAFIRGTKVKMQITQSKRKMVSESKTYKLVRSIFSVFFFPKFLFKFTFYKIPLPL